MEGDQNNPHITHILLDGSYGAGPLAEVTIITKIPDSTNNKREVYQIPYLLIDIPRLMRLNDANFILGFEVIKGEKTPSGLKELGL